MNKKEFLDILHARLAGLPQDDIERSLEFYEEMIDDRMEDGMDEQQAVNEIGSVDEAVAQILSETPLQRLLIEKAKPSHTLRTWEIVLLALGSPVWVSLLLAAACIFFSVYILIWSLVVVIYCVSVSFAAGAVSGAAGSIMLLFIGNPLSSLLFLGAGLICAGITVFMFFASKDITVAVAGLSKMLLIKTKSMFLRKERA